MSQIRKRLRLTREEALMAKPVKNINIRWKKNEKGEVLLYLSRKKSKIINLLSRIFFIPEEKIINLDKVGTYVWELCNGENSVKEIVVSLQKKFNLNFKESEVSTLEYLKKLAQRGIIGLAISKKR
ncbi:MAG TPA: PqqD family protein [Candidatus Omnitrophica bacterium]|nr:PqqD family protein [Candidatus Omnitrophota bacterium]